MCVTLELPHFGTRIARRYVQLLDGTAPQLVDVEPIPIPRQKLSEREIDHLLATSRARIEQIFVDRMQRDIDEISRQAAAIAMGHDARQPGSFLQWFRAELERVPLDPPELLDDLVRQAQARVARGLPVFDDSAMLLR